MAPPNNTAKAQKGASGKKSTRPMVPAIPLPHVKRQAAAAAKVAASSRPASLPGSEPKSGDGLEGVKAKGSSPAVSTVTAAAANDSADGQTATSSTPSTAAPNGHSRDEDHDPKPEDAQQSRPASEADVPDDSKLDDKTPRPPFMGKLPNGIAQLNPPKANREFAPGDKPAPSEFGPAVSANRHHIPPPFPPPVDKLVSPTSNGDAARASRPPVVNGHAQVQNSRPSHGGIHFGAFSGSSGSSPAPPLSGGIAPPPGMSAPDTRQPYLSHPSGAFPPGMPSGMDIMGAATFDAYGRPNMSYPPMDPYHQYGSNFPPSTPQSFQDSPSSVHPDDSGPYRHFAGTTPVHGPPGFGDDAASQNHPANIPRNAPFPAMGSQGPPTSMMPPDDDASGLVEHFQQQFGSSDFADCSLELRSRDHRIAPLKIPGHRIVLSRSSVLDKLIRNNVQQSTPQPLVLETEDGWVRPDTFYMACQRLYGLPLLHPLPPRHSVDGDNVAAAGSAIDRFHFALSYAAAGHLIGWGPVVRRGCQIAAQLLDLDTIELAMSFALTQYKDNASHEEFKYGDGSRIILDAVLDFIVARMPSTFQLDTSVTEMHGYARLPYDIPSPARSADTNPASPVVVRGPQSGGHFSKGSRGQSHPLIQFGDLSLGNGGTGEPSDTPQGPQPATSLFQVVLSRVLLNMPFGHLKMLVDSGPRNLLPVVQETVQERDARRARALAVLNSGRIPVSGVDRSSLRGLEPPQSNPWAVLGWQEGITFSSNADGPTLGRQWIPLKEDNQGSVAEYP